MNNVKYFIDLFETIPDYKKIVLLKFLIKNDVYFSHDCGFLKSDNTFLFKRISKQFT